jgi:hypothetical protein
MGMKGCTGAIHPLLESYFERRQEKHPAALDMLSMYPQRFLLPHSIFKSDLCTTRSDKIENKP